MISRSRDLLFDFDLEFALALRQIEVEAEVSREERGTIRGLFDVEHDHHGLVAFALEEEDVRSVGAESNGIGHAVEGHFVEVDRDILGNAIESNRLFVRAGTDGEQRKEDSADSNREIEGSRHSRSVARGWKAVGKPTILRESVRDKEQQRVTRSQYGRRGIDSL